MLVINDLKAGVYIVLDGEPYVILKHDFVKMGRGQGVMRTTIQALKTGKTLDRSFKGQDKVEPADISRSKANFLYREDSNYYFMDSSTYDQFFVTEDQIGADKVAFLKENLEVDVLNFNGNPITVELPKKIEYRVTSAPPGIRGDTAQGSVLKKVTLETGYVMDAPLFIEEGAMIVLNTDTGKYVGKA
ncbi:MAG: elongation factor P [Patescibacteria group bacterium]|nr:elongation factor P [Patescibacteria group bacterium]MDD5715815.1 elongation factor P [Patescibacteria group bacterium]